MKYILLSLVLLSVSCASKNKKDFKFKIEGKVKVNIQTGDFFTGYKQKSVIGDAIAYTDTIYGCNEDSIWYYNTNGTKVNILSPYKVYKIN